MSEAEAIRETAIKTSQDHNEMVRKQAETFEENQHGIDTRLMILTESDTTESAAKEFETRLEKLRGLEIAKGYMEILGDVDVVRLVAETTQPTSFELTYQ